MLREKLIVAAKEAVSTEGYDFYTGFAYRIHNEITKFPAAWLLPLQIIAVDGYMDGYLTYKATMHLMHLDKKMRPESREQQWGRMEVAALKILNTITFGQQVFNVQGIRCTPEEHSLTNHGEITLKIECEVRMRFCPADTLRTQDY